MESKQNHDIVKATQPVMDVASPPPPGANDSGQQPGVQKTSAPAKSSQATSRPNVPVTPKQPKSGNAGAIIATVIIVLGLAALATYAYLQPK